MPSIQDLNAFKGVVNQFGNEPEVAQSKDEVLEDIQPGENSSPLMPELAAMREALEQENQAKAENQQQQTNEEAPPASVEEPETAPAEIVMSEEAVPTEDSDPDFDVNLPDDRADRVIEDADEPDADALVLPQTSDEPSDSGDTDPEPVTPFVPVNESFQIPGEPDEEEASDPEFPSESVYRMLDTGFGGLDSERLNADILEKKSGDGSAALEQPQSEAPAEEAPSADVGNERPEALSDLPVDENEAENELGLPEEPSEVATEAGGLSADSNPFVEPDFPEDMFPGDDGSLVEGVFEAGSPGDSPQANQESSGNADFLEVNDDPVFPNEDDDERDEGFLSPPEAAMSALDSIAQLEQALQQHRSIDLLNINEEHVEEENVYEELEFHISHEYAREFLLQLSSYPIALKLAIEEEIGENELDETTIETLVEMVSAGVDPRRVANYFFSQTGKRILLPKGHRYHAHDWDDINSRFDRQFAQIGFPLIQRAFLGVFLLAIFFWLPFYYIYRPVQSHLYYQRGYSEISQDHFDEAERYFTLASNGWPLFNDTFFVKGWPYRSWFLRYAEAYAARKDFVKSTSKLDETLRFYPDYRSAWFQYIGLLSQEMGEYAEAEEVIQQYYDRFGRDYDSLIVRGQNYLDWGDVDPVYYEEARQIFGATYGLESKDDLPLLYLLDYYIRTASYDNNETQLQKLTSFFLSADPTSLEVPSELFARVISRTADYYLRRGKVEVAKKLLLNAAQTSENSMEIYRSFARYYDMINDDEKKMEALNMSLFFLGYRDDRSTTLNLLEKFSLTKEHAQFVSGQNDTSFDASVVFNDLLVQLRAVEQRHLNIDRSEAADVYAMFGNFYYRNIPESLSAIPYYRKSIDLGIKDPYINYKLGHQFYQRRDFEPAVEQFLESQLKLTDNNKIKYALGNSLLQVGSYNSAQGILEEVYSSLQGELHQSFLIDPQHSQEARDRLFMLVRLANDLGVSYHSERLRSLNVNNEDTAMAYLIQGMGYLDILSREDTVSLKLPPELLFRPRLLTKKTINMLENAIPAQGLVPGSLPDRNLKEILENKISTPVSSEEIRPYWLDILDPIGLQKTMDY
ncbi:hypothetical protein P0082_02935 [Candidatus Haliotispira prima]|uniref:Tetratricopeptide repeat protein n=1 Tax=Candidatus Haliotispira prima TaxID=3034016 RepID=A0ABY8MKV6_9SPIO|nr:hypothetical protein P0082_02935 [Candidatus Haliotispira prima]